MKIGFHCTLPLVALMAGACVAEVGGFGEEDELDGDIEGEIEEGEDNDGELDGPVDVDRWTPELAEPERVDEPAPDDAGIIAATGSRAWALTVWYGTAGSTADFGDGNAPDLYVKRFCGGAYRNKTAVKSNTRSPVWNATLLAAQQTDAYVKSCYFELWDSDDNAHDFGGRVYVSDVVTSMIQNRQTSLKFKRSFTANDHVIVWFHFTRR